MLTGTPLQNDLAELMALLQFTVPSLLGRDAARLVEVFGGGNAAARSREDALVASQRVARAKRIMAPFVLRRKKSQVLDQLPPKTDVVQRCPLGARQRMVYDAVVRESKERMRKEIQGICAQTNSTCGAVGSFRRRRGCVGCARRRPRAGGAGAAQVNNVLMQLRKAANHPALLRIHYTDAMLKTMAHLILRVRRVARGGRRALLMNAHMSAHPGRASALATGWGPAGA